MPLPTDLTWTCHVCGAERPDERISVYTLSEKIGIPGMEVPVKANVRYCNDRDECRDRAPSMAESWLHEGRERD